SDRLSRRPAGAHGRELVAWRVQRRASLEPCRRLSRPGGQTDLRLEHGGRPGELAPLLAAVRRLEAGADGAEPLRRGSALLRFSHGLWFRSGAGRLARPCRRPATDPALVIPPCWTDLAALLARRPFRSGSSSWFLQPRPRPRTTLRGRRRVR